MSRCGVSGGGCLTDSIVRYSGPFSHQVHVTIRIHCERARNWVLNIGIEDVLGDVSYAGSPL